MIKKILTLLFLMQMVLFCASAEVSAEPSENESQEIIRVLEQTIKNSINKIIEIEKDSGIDFNKFHYVYPITSKKMINLGMLLDLEKSEKRRGYKVLSITHNSSADKMGLKIGDRIVEINGVKVRNRAYISGVKMLEDFSGGELVLTIIRHGKRIVLNTFLDLVQLPNTALIIGNPNSASDINSSVKLVTLSCGSVSSLYSENQPDEVKRVTIKEIDNRKVSENKTNFTLPVGRHTLKISHGLTKNSVFKEANQHQHIKELTINIEENVSYQIGALEISGNKSDGFSKISIPLRRSKVYWQPVIWKVHEKPSKNCSNVTGMLPQSIDEFQRLSKQIQSALFDIEAVESDWLNSSSRSEILVNIPAETRVDLGLVVSLKRELKDRGLRILLVSPLGVADKMGLKSGDRIVSVNQKRLFSENIKSDYLYLIKQLSGEELILDVVRKGKKLRFSSHLPNLKIPSIRLVVEKTDITTQ